MNDVFHIESPPRYRRREDPMSISMPAGLRWLPVVALLLAGLASAQPAPLEVPGIREAQLSADYWIGRARQADSTILDGDGVATRNAVMERVDPSLYDIESLPATLDREQVQAWIEQASPRPTRTLYDETGKEGSQRAIDRLVDALDLRRIPPTQVTRYGLVVRRADLRTFPTHLRVFSSPEDRDIDRFQESALFPGTPVVVVHESRDRQWLFVVSRTYAAWIERDAVAFGDRNEVLSYGTRTPFAVVTGAMARTVYSREEPRVSEVQLDMGVRLPLLRELPDGGLVNGQHPYYGHAVELPVRNDDGTLAFRPALIPRAADVSIGYLPLTRANILRQAFKFLGERYGWGHSYNSRDCSGFVSEVYRSMGILLPRNTSAQSVSPALDRIELPPDMPHEKRLELLRDTQVGDLLYIPGHVMMVVGHEGSDTYVIHDTTGMTYRDADGALQRLPLNGVVVTPVLPMLYNAEQPTVDRITSIQRIRP
jgi:cell wall-associated NlpC family hydrolase